MPQSDRTPAVGRHRPSQIGPRGDYASPFTNSLRSRLVFRSYSLKITRAAVKHFNPLGSHLIIVSAGIAKGIYKYIAITENGGFSLILKCVRIPFSQPTAIGS
jgi:hypothetical protein